MRNIIVFFTSPNVPTFDPMVFSYNNIMNALETDPFKNQSLALLIIYDQAEIKAILGAKLKLGLWMYVLPLIRRY